MRMSPIRHELRPVQKRMTVGQQILHSVGSHERWIILIGTVRKRFHGGDQTRGSKDPSDPMEMGDPSDRPTNCREQTGRVPMGPDLIHRSDEDLLMHEKLGHDDPLFIARWGI